MSQSQPDNTIPDNQYWGWGWGGVLLPKDGEVGRVIVRVVALASCVHELGGGTSEEEVCDGRCVFV